MGTGRTEGRCDLDHAAVAWPRVAVISSLPAHALLPIVRCDSVGRTRLLCCSLRKQHSGGRTVGSTRRQQRGVVFARGCLADAAPLLATVALPRIAAPWRTAERRWACADSRRLPDGRHADPAVSHSRGTPMLRVAPSRTGWAIPMRLPRCRRRTCRVRRCPCSGSCRGRRSCRGGPRSQTSRSARRSHMGLAGRPGRLEVSRPRGRYFAAPGTDPSTGPTTLCASSGSIANCEDPTSRRRSWTAGCNSPAVRFGSPCSWAPASEA